MHGGLANPLAAPDTNVFAQAVDTTGNIYVVSTALNGQVTVFPPHVPGTPSAPHTTNPLSAGLTAAGLVLGTNGNIQWIASSVAYEKPQGGQLGNIYVTAVKTQIAETISTGAVFRCSVSAANPPVASGCVLFAATGLPADPTGISVDNNRNIYVVSAGGNGNVKNVQFGPSTTALTTLPSNYAFVTIYTNTAANFVSTCLDNNGNLFLVDAKSGSGLIHRWPAAIASGSTWTTSGAQAVKVISISAFGTTQVPNNCAVDAQNNLYVGTSIGNVLRAPALAFHTSTTFITAATASWISTFGSVGAMVYDVPRNQLLIGENNAGIIYSYPLGDAVPTSTRTVANIGVAVGTTISLKLVTTGIISVSAVVTAGFGTMGGAVAVQAACVPGALDATSCEPTIGFTVGATNIGNAVITYSYTGANALFYSLPAPIVVLVLGTVTVAPIAEISYGVATPVAFTYLPLPTAAGVPLACTPIINVASTQGGGAVSTAFVPTAVGYTAGIGNTNSVFTATVATYPTVTPIPQLSLTAAGSSASCSIGGVFLWTLPGVNVAGLNPQPASFALTLVQGVAVIVPASFTAGTPPAYVFTLSPPLAAGQTLTITPTDETGPAQTTPPAVGAFTVGSSTAVTLSFAVIAATPTQPVLKFSFTAGGGLVLANVKLSVGTTAGNQVATGTLAVPIQTGAWSATAAASATHTLPPFATPLTLTKYNENTIAAGAINLQAGVFSSSFLVCLPAVNTITDKSITIADGAGIAGTFKSVAATGASPAAASCVGVTFGAPSGTLTFPFAGGNSGCVCFQYRPDAGVAATVNFNDPARWTGAVNAVAFAANTAVAWTVRVYNIAVLSTLTVPVWSAAVTTAQPALTNTFTLTLSAPAVAGVTVTAVSTNGGAGITFGAVGAHIQTIAAGATLATFTYTNTAVPGSTDTITLTLSGADVTAGLFVGSAGSVGSNTYTRSVALFGLLTLVTQPAAVWAGVAAEFVVNAVPVTTANAKVHAYDGANAAAIAGTYAEVSNPVTPPALPPVIGSAVGAAATIPSGKTTGAAAVKWALTVPTANVVAVGVVAANKLAIGAPIAVTFVASGSYAFHPTAASHAIGTVVTPSVLASTIVVTTAALKGTVVVSVPVAPGTVTPTFFASATAFVFPVNVFPAVATLTDLTIALAGGGGTWAYVGSPSNLGAAAVSTLSAKHDGTAALGPTPHTVTLAGAASANYVYCIAAATPLGTVGPAGTPQSCFASGSASTPSWSAQANVVFTGLPTSLGFDSVNPAIGTFSITPTPGAPLPGGVVYTLGCTWTAAGAAPGTVPGACPVGFTFTPATLSTGALTFTFTSGVGFPTGATVFFTASTAATNWNPLITSAAMPIAGTLRFDPLPSPTAANPVGTPIVYTVRIGPTPISILPVTIRDGSGAGTFATAPAGSPPGQLIVNAAVGAATFTFTYTPKSIKPVVFSLSAPGYANGGAPILVTTTSAFAPTALTTSAGTAVALSVALAQGGANGGFTLSVCDTAAGSALSAGGSYSVNGGAAVTCTLPAGVALVFGPGQNIVQFTYTPATTGVFTIAPVATNPLSGADFAPNVLVTAPANTIVVTASSGSVVIAGLPPTLPVGQKVQIEIRIAPAIPAGGDLTVSFNDGPTSMGGTFSANSVQFTNNGITKLFVTYTAPAVQPILANQFGITASLSGTSIAAYNILPNIAPAPGALSTATVASAAQTFGMGINPAPATTGVVFNAVPSLSSIAKTAQTNNLGSGVPLNWASAGLGQLDADFGTAGPILQFTNAFTAGQLFPPQPAGSSPVGGFPAYVANVAFNVAAVVVSVVFNKGTITVTHAATGESYSLPNKVSGLVTPPIFLETGVNNIQVNNAAGDGIYQFNIIRAGISNLCVAAATVAVDSSNLFQNGPGLMVPGSIKCLDFFDSTPGTYTLTVPYEVASAYPYLQGEGPAYFVAIGNPAANPAPPQNSLALNWAPFAGAGAPAPNPGSFIGITAGVITPGAANALGALVVGNTYTVRGGPENLLFTVNIVRDGKGRYNHNIPAFLCAATAYRFVAGLNSVTTIAGTTAVSASGGVVVGAGPGLTVIGSIGAAVVWPANTIDFTTPAAHVFPVVITFTPTTIGAGTAAITQTHTIYWGGC
jgi:hypothetical protein